MDFEYFDDKISVRHRTWTRDAGRAPQSVRAITRTQGAYACGSSTASKRLDSPQSNLYLRSSAAILRTAVWFFIRELSVTLLFCILVDAPSPRRLEMHIGLGGGEA
jgi:hypothetical protein